MLDAVGVKQAVDAGKKLLDLNIEIAFASPLVRAQQTCQIAMSTWPHDRRVPIITDYRILEGYFGNAEGKVVTPESYVSRDFWGKRELASYDDMESLEEMDARVKNFFDEIRTKHKGKNVLVVCHGGIMRMMAAYFLGKPESGKYHDLGTFKNCEILSFDN